MPEKIYTLKLTKKQLWLLQQGYDASFTAPGEKSDIEKTISNKLAALYQKAHKGHRPMTNETQETIDRAYSEGKASYFRAVGTHGPSLKPRPFFNIPNPYPIGTLCREAWSRGYNQDTRRVIAGVTKPTLVRT